LSSKYNNTWIVNDKNEVYVCGDNKSGQARPKAIEDDHLISFQRVLLEKNTPIAFITNGLNHTFIVTEESNTTFFGCSKYGQLG